MDTHGPHRSHRRVSTRERVPRRPTRPDRRHAIRSARGVVASASSRRLVTARVRDSERSNARTREAPETDPNAPNPRRAIEPAMRTVARAFATTTTSSARCDYRRRATTTRATTSAVRADARRARSGRYAIVPRSIEGEGNAAVVERSVEGEEGEKISLEARREALRLPRPDVAAPGMEDPWNDEKWQKVKWTVFRDVAYDLGPFFEKHPGGNWLLNLAIGRDCTALMESYHLRPEVATARFRMLPKLEGFPVDAVAKSPRPNDSPLYNNIRNRVREELFPEEGKNKHRMGGDHATITILSFAAFAYGVYATIPGFLSGCLLGLAGAWIGLTIQHCANHGAMSPSPAVNGVLGLTNDLIGGSSLMWRYHHQVSHHIHCNDNAMDQDVYTAMPLLRFDARRPKAWYHRFQHWYMFLAFPLLQVAFQVGDIVGLFTRDTEGAKLHGATTWELATVVIGKFVHFGLLAAPLMSHAASAVVAGIVGFMACQGVVLACTFAVSHNVPEAKLPEDTGGEAWERDWGVQQLVTSADWGGKIGNFFTGGLNLQVEHHLFPAICFVHYPAIAKIVAEEAAKMGIPYSSYRTLPGIFVAFWKFVRDMGTAEQIDDVLLPKFANPQLSPAIN